MRTKSAVVFLVLTLFGLLLGGCAKDTDYFDDFQGAFSAEVEGEMNGVAFSALVEAAAAPAEGMREVTVTFYAPEGVKGVTVRRNADGTCVLSSGNVSVEPDAAGFAPLLDLFPISGQVNAVTLTDEGYTKVAGNGFSLTLLPDGTPYAVETPAVTARVVRFEQYETSSGGG